MRHFGAFLVAVFCLAAFCLAALPAWAADATHGDITGTLVFDGDIPAPVKITPTKDVEVCGKHQLFDEVLVVGKDGGIRDIVIRLFVPVGGKAPAAHPDYDKTATAEVNFDNINCRFEPHVALLRTTQTLVVGNKDPIAHNSAINSQANTAQNPLLPPNASLQVKMAKPERLPVKVACSIHPWMGGLIVVSDHPYMAATDATGKFTIKNVPVGKHTFQAWHDKSGYVTQLAGGKEWKLGRFEVTVEANKETDLGTVKVLAKNFMKP